MRQLLVVALLVICIITSFAGANARNSRAITISAYSQNVVSHLGSNILDPGLLGKSDVALSRRFGSPQVRLRDKTGRYSAFPIMGNRAWLVAYLRNNVIESVEIAPATRNLIAGADEHGVAFGDTLSSMQDRFGERARFSASERALVLEDRGRVYRFYGVDQQNDVDRIGFSLGHMMQFPPYIRWYQANGTERERPAEIVASDTKHGEFLARESVAGTTCGAASKWWPIGAGTLVNGLYVVRISCYSTGLTRDIFFKIIPPSAAYGNLPRNGQFLAPHVYQTARPMLHHGRGGPVLSRPVISERVEPQTPRHVMATSAPLRVWLTAYSQPPNGRRFIYPNTLNTEFAYDTTANPTGFDVIVASGANSPGADGDFNRGIGGGMRRILPGLIRTGPLSHGRLALGRSHRTTSQGRIVPDDGSPQYLAQNCPFGSGSINKCDWTNPPYDHGSVCTQVLMYTATATYASNVGCVQIAKDPSDFEHHKTCGQGPSDGASGGPVDIVSGSLWYYYKDAGLSGPFGLQFARHYSSKWSTYQGSLGIGWRSMFDAALDLTQVANGQVTFTSECGDHQYFSVPVVGATVYDQFSGSTLGLNANGTYTLRSWTGASYGFDSSGRVMSFSDRVGNVQTITRSTSNPTQVLSISDVLGRSLTFTYDSSNRIKTVASSPTALSISFTYDSGTNCNTGDLCKVTESDGSTWNYQYGLPANYENQHLLTAVINPLGHTEEQNTYALITLGVYANSTSFGNWTIYRVTQQARDGGARAVTYGYSSFENTSDDFLGNTYTEDQDGRYTNYDFDMNLQAVTSVEGPECHCGSGSLYYEYDVFGRPIEYDDMESTRLLNQRTYADALFTAPDGSVSYIGTAIPQTATLSQLYYPNYPSLPTTRVMTSVNYPFGDPRQDLVQTETIPSVDTPGKVLTATHTYATNGTLTQESRAGYINGVLTTYNWKYTYDSKGRLLTITAPRTDLTQLTQYSYYPDTDTDLARRGQRKTTTDALGHVETLASAPSPYNTYNLYGDPLSVVSANAVTTEFTYNKLGGLTKSSVLAAGSESDVLTTSYAFDAGGRFTGTTRPLGNQIQYGYTNEDDLSTASIVPKGGVVQEKSSSTFDVAGVITMSANQSCTSGSCTTTTFSQGYTPDSFGDITSIPFSAPANAKEALSFYNYGYTSGQSLEDGAVFAQKFETGSVTDMEYDTVYDYYHHITQLSVGSSSSSTAGYRNNSFNIHGELAQTALASGAGAAQQTMLYDDFGRVRSTTASSTGTTSYTYDAANNNLTAIDGNGAKATTTYDALNRPLVRTFTKSGATTEVVTKTYDSTTSGAFGIGRLATMTDPSGKTTYTYERRGLVSSESRTINGSVFTTGYTYDDNGNIASITYPSGHVATYTYDFEDRPLTVSFASNPIVSAATYLPFGPLASISFANKTVQAKTFDTRYRIASNTLTSPTNAKLAALSYTEDSANRLLTVTDTLNAGYDQTITYSPSASSAPQLATFSTGSLLWGAGAEATDRSFEVLGLSYPSYLGKAHTLTFTAGNNSGQPSGVTVDGTASSISYDARGQQTALGSATSVYSARELLRSANGITYSYDGDGQRVSAIKGTATRSSIYDFQNHNLLAESSLTSSSSEYEYIWFGDRLVAESSASGVYSVFTDHLGAPEILTSSTGSVVWQADYEPYGAVYSLRTADIHQPIRRPGQEAEEFDDSAGPNGDTPRYFNHSRWYIPKWGSYTQPDTRGIAGSPYGEYAYAGNDPYSQSDASGECLVQARYDRVHFFIATNGWHETVTTTPNDDAGNPLSNSIPKYFSGYPQLNPLKPFFGNLMVKTGQWIHGGSDPVVNNWDKYSEGTQSPVFATTADNDCSCVNATLDALENSINNANIGYDPFNSGPSSNVVEPGGLEFPVAAFGNSNTFAYMAPQALGVQPPAPPAYITTSPYYFPDYNDPFPNLLK